MRIWNWRPDEIIWVVETEVLHMNTVLRDEEIDSKYGYLVVAYRDSGRIRLMAEIGSVPSTSRSIIFAPEKATRLAEHQNVGHNSSWLSRDHDENKYGGAIVARNFIFSFSGIPSELADESVMLSSVRRLGLISQERMLAVAEISSNTYLRKRMEITGGEIPIISRK